MPSRQPPSISASFVGALIQLAAARGLDPRPLFERAALRPEEVSDPERRVPLAIHHDLWGHVARALDDPGLPVHFGQGRRLEDLHVVGFAVASSMSGREALLRVCRYGRLLSDAGRWELCELGGGRELALRYVSASTFSLGERLNVESAVTGCLSCFRQSKGLDFAPTEVTFRHPAPRDTSAHRRFFRCPIQFGAPSDGFSFPPDLISGVPRGANPALSAFFERHAEALLQRAAPEASTSERVREAVARELASGEPTIVAIARRLGMSERSLRRHLGEEGTSFREVIEEVRRRTAEHLLRDRAITIPDIAYLCGFADVTAFTRAFKRWFGVPPGKFRGGAVATGA